MKPCEIDLSNIAGRVYVGRPNGIAARKHFRLDELESENRYPITITFPDNAKTLASSFFLGMLGESVRAAGSREAFLHRYKFNANSQIRKEIEVGITEALTAG
ncbi:hypothetical protein ACPUEJ_01475 [Vibrio tubiashii]|uniref:hypothetical protein n=1 Tax=Vibrio tubiashii TaxID=29498 RepID=UPI003CE45098